MKKIILITIILLAFFLRLYRINNPIADWHSWRQADTASVSRNFVKNGFDFLRPRFDDLSDVASKFDNPEGYRFVEFPIYNALHAGLYELWPIYPLEEWGRLLSIIFSLGSLIFLFLIAKKFLGEKTAFLAAFFFAVLPFNIYYNRVILPEPMMIFTSLGTIWFYTKWICNTQCAINNTQYSLFLLLGTFFAALSWLIKPFTLVLLLPIFYLSLRQWHFNWKKQIPLFFCLILSLLPFIAWRLWMKQFPEGIPYLSTLFNLTGIRLKGAFFWWLFEERIGKLILGGWGLIPFGIGLILKPNKKEGLFFYNWLTAILIYFLVVAGGNVQHDYYQVLAIPIICIFLAKGTYFLLSQTKQFSRIASCVLLIVSVLFMFAFSWYQVRDYFNINNSVIIEAGKAVDQLVPKDAKVIAPYGGDTAFLYQTNRQGWPIGIEIERMIKLGATHYVNVNFGPETDWLLAIYCPIENNDRFVIIDLTKKCTQ